MAKIRDVARLAGVSAMTVSRTLNQPNLVDPATRGKVLAAVEQLGYVPNGVARSLTRGKTDVIALVLPDIQNPFFTILSRGVEDVAQQYGYTLMVGNTDERAEKERQYIDVLLSRRVDGVILATAGADHVRLLQRRRIPLVLVDRVIPGIDVDTVIHDAYDGGRQVVQHLLAQGYRDIMFIGGLPRNSTIEARLDGCRDTMREAGLSLSVRLGRLDQACGEEIIASVCAEERVPEAIVAANNLVAVGAMAEMRRQHLNVPDDVGLACFGDIELASLLDPFLTVITQPAHEIGRIAMQILYDRISGADDPPRRHVLSVQLIARRSTRRAAEPRP